MESLSTIIEAEFKNSGIEDTQANRRIFKFAIERGYIIGMNKPVIQIKNIEAYRDEIVNNVALRDYLCMQSRITVEKYNTLRETFILEQKAINKIYSDSSDVFKHLSNWIRYQVKIEKDNPNAFKSKSQINQL